MVGFDIIDSMKRQFNKTLKSRERIKIVFWNDYDKEFEDITSKRLNKTS